MLLVVRPIWLHMVTKGEQLTCMHWKTCSATPGASTSIRLGLNRTSGAIMRSAATRMVRPSGRVYDCTRQVVSLASCNAHDSSESSDLHSRAGMPGINYRSTAPCLLFGAALIGRWIC